MFLLRDLGLDNAVSIKAYKRPTEEDQRYLLIIHVKSDHVFHRYVKAASMADMALYRGMILHATLTHGVQSRSNDKTPQVKAFGVQQAFLPKFENEAQDQVVADRIVEAADTRYMVVSVKHSGSLNTLSHELIAAKNSISNFYTSVAVLTLHAHYQRLSDSKEEGVDARLERLLGDMAAKRLSVSFETVSRCTPQHGQLPHAEYMVVTSISHLSDDGTIQVLPLSDLLHFCEQHVLPVNDTWLFESKASAAAARAALDSIATSGTPTLAAITSLDAVAAAHSSVRVPGSYPHHEWQGSRVEGFVVSQGEAISAGYAARVATLAAKLATQQLHAGDALDPSASDLLRFACMRLSGEGWGVGGGGGVAAPDDAVRTAADVAPAFAKLQVGWEAVNSQEGEALLEVLCSAALRAHDGAPRPMSRCELACASAHELALFAGDCNELRELLEQAAHSSQDGRMSRQLVNAAMQLKWGSLHSHTALRYKKKMMLFRMAGPDGSPPGHVGYCMMTFLIRNGLKALHSSAPLYLQYVHNLVTRWGLVAEQQAECLRFSAAWSSWVTSQNKLESLRPESYLDVAEEFVELFTQGRLPARTSKGFYGVVLMIGFDEEFVNETQARSGVMQRDVGAKMLHFGPLLPEMGLLIAINALPQSAGPQIRFWQDAAHVLMIVERPLPVLVHPPSQEEKGTAHQRCLVSLRKGVDGAIAALTAYCEAKGVDLTTRLLRLEEPSWAPEWLLAGGKPPSDAPQAPDRGVQEITPPTSADASLQPPVKKARKKAVKPHVRNVAADLGKLVPPSAHVHLGPQRAADMQQAVVRWLGSGLPRLERDPSLIVIFVGIPGLGKTTISERLVTQLGGKCDVTHHHADALPVNERKATAFWTAAATKSITRRRGRTQVILADKSLLDSPEGNWRKVASHLAASDSKVLAVLFTDQAGQEALSSNFAESDATASGLPLVPPHLLATAVMRVSDRKDHVGELDDRVADVRRIVCNFASTFRKKRARESAHDLDLLFGNVLPLAVVKRVEDPPDTPATQRLMTLMEEGAKLASFGCKGESLLTDAWDQEVKELLADSDVRSFLEGLAMLEDEVVTRVAEAVETAVQRGKAIDTAAHAQVSTRYIAVTGLDWGQLDEAFGAAQKQVGRETILRAKHQLHVTLWHIENGSGAGHDAKRRQLADVAGSQVEVLVEGFDFGKNIAAARVQLCSSELPQGAVQELLHITMWHDDTTEAVHARKLQLCAEEDGGGVQYVALQEAIVVNGTITCE